MRLIHLFLICLVLISGCVHVSRQDKLTSEDRLKLAEARTKSAVAYMKVGRFNIAYKDLQLALKMNPHHSMANNYMAILKWKYKDYKEANKYFRRAVDNDPKNATAYNNYGTFLCERGRIGMAIEAYKKAINNPLYTKTAYANENAGICLMRKPAPAEAEKFFRAALGEIPRLRKSLYYMAKITYDSGRLLSARGFMQRYIEIARKKPSPEALLLAVKIERSSGNGNRAASYAFRLRNLYPESRAAKELKQIGKSPVRRR